MVALLAYIRGLLRTLLPPKYREDDPTLRGQAIVSGLLQGFAALLLIVFGLFRFWAGNAERIGERSDLVWNYLGGGALYGSGILAMAEFGTQPLTIFGYYFFFEGIVRTMAALIGHQVIGTLPLYAVSAVHGLWSQSQHGKYLGPLIEDEVIRGTERSNYDLKIYSCRPKLDWNPYVTIQFEDQFYQMIREEPGPESRRFIYYLRKNPVGRIVVQVFPYQTTDVLKPASPKIYPGEQRETTLPSGPLG